MGSSNFSAALVEVIDDDSSHLNYAFFSFFFFFFRISIHPRNRALIFDVPESLFWDQVCVYIYRWIPTTSTTLYSSWFSAILWFRRLFWWTYIALGGCFGLSTEVARLQPFPQYRGCCNYCFPFPLLSWTQFCKWPANRILRWEIREFYLLNAESRSIYILDFDPSLMTTIFSRIPSWNLQSALIHSNFSADRRSSGEGEGVVRVVVDMSCWWCNWGKVFGWRKLRVFRVWRRQKRRTLRRRIRRFRVRFPWCWWWVRVWLWG